MTRLSKAALQRAVNHLIRYGDTDVLPHPIEAVFLYEKKTSIIDELLKLDLDSFNPTQALETISPKSRFGFRIIHQLPLVETILFTASIIEIGADLEKLKRPLNEFGPFAYRFLRGKSTSIFEADRSFKKWLEWQRNQVNVKEYPIVILTDIADFYQRIYFHRIENILDSATKKRGITNFIKKLIKQIRSRQSHGIPVGGTASRLIAEVLLSDTDSALANEEYLFTRYVDDFRLFVRANETPYAVLAFLADQLATTEGLSLNAQKTRIIAADEFASILDLQLTDVFDEAGQAAIASLGATLYSDEMPDENEIERLRGLNLLNLLDHETLRQTWDFGRIRTILFALRFTVDASAVVYFPDRLETFLPFMKEIVPLMQRLYKSGVDLSYFGERVLEELRGRTAISVPTIRFWLLELYVRGYLKLAPKEVSTVAQGDTLTNRQGLLIRGLNRDVNYFRRNKTRFDQQNSFEKFPFLLGATCLPEDEFKTWVSAVRGGMDRPLDRLFCNWIQSKCGQLSNLIASREKRARENL
jgi:hypothetical protein